MNEDKARKMKNRDGEKGSAMVMALLISFLLLVASAAVLLESSMNTANVTDATADQQAYNAAESGIQSAINVLRGNVPPNPLLDSSKSSTDPANQISFVRALNLSKSNLSTDTSGYARFSRWLGYNYTPTGASLPDRVTIGATTAVPYAERTGYAYSLVLLDPDNTGTNISYTTSAEFYDADDETNPIQKTYGSSGNTVKVAYTSASVTNLDVSSGSANTNIGKLTFTVSGSGATIPAFNRFVIRVNMTKPYTYTKEIRGFVETGSVTNATIASGTPKYIFDSQTFTIMGSVTTMSITGGANVYVTSPIPQRVGYEVPVKSGDNTLTATMTPAEPTRLLVRSTGYGPRGATKQLEAIIQKNFFNGLGAPATLLMVGPASTPATATQAATSFVFNSGSSAAMQYSGDDVVSTDIIAPVGTTNMDNLGIVQDAVDGQPPHPFNGTIVGTPADVTKELPGWLKNPLALETAIQSLYDVAKASGGYYAPGSTPSSFGNNSTAKGITFVDHDVSFGGSGGGILVVTGKLTLNGGFSFNGLIIVTGQGGVERNGGGGGTLQGNVVIAPYEHSKIIKTAATGTTAAVLEDKSTVTATSTFLAPQYDLSGGGNSTVVYNSSNVANGLTAISNFALGVAEK